MYQRVKEEMKNWALGIRSLKEKRPLKNRGNIPLYEIEGNIFMLKREFRHHHIAMSELRGKTRDQIEKPRESNKPNEDYIKRIKMSLTDERIVSKNRNVA